MKKKTFSIAVIALFALVILLPWGLSLAGADAETGGGDAKEIRSLAEFPTELSNDYFAKINAYVNDHSPMRNSIINLVTEQSDALNGYYIDHIVAPLSQSDSSIYSALAENIDFSCILSDASSTPTNHAHEYRVIREQKASYQHDGYTLEKCTICGSARVADAKLRSRLKGFYDKRTPVVYTESGFAGTHDWYFYSAGNSVSFVQGDNMLSQEEMSEWKDAFEELKAECDKRGIDLVVLVCPNKEMVYKEYLPSGIDLSKPDNEKRESVMAEYMKENSSVHYLYPLEAEKAAKVIYETYYQQDTHWTDAGAYVAVMQIYEALGMPHSGLDDVETTERIFSGGDLVNLGIGPAVDYTDYKIEYKPEITVVQTQSFSNTVKGDNDTPNYELRILESNAPGDRKAVIVGDSFRRLMAPFISKDYSKTTVGHKGNLDLISNYSADADGNISPCGKQVLLEAIKELGEGDLLILESVERVDHTNVSVAKELTEILSGDGR